MPFTPFHFGPGLLIKSVAPGQVSFTSFVASQVLIDFETLYYIRQNSWPVHRFAHSVAGGLIAGTLTAVSLAWLARWLASRTEGGSRDLLVGLTMKKALIGGLLGGLTHTVLDSIMHLDTRLWFPFGGNPLHEIVDVQTLHLACMFCGVLGLLFLVGQLMITRR